MACRVLPLRALAGLAVLAACSRDVTDEMSADPPGCVRLPGPGAGTRVAIQAREVSNAQYLAFVRATQYRPPIDWYREALDLASRGQGPIQDPEAWVRVHPDARWRIPPGEEGHPVTGVTLQDAERYARWSGQRLPTVEEFGAAATLAVGGAVSGLSALPCEWTSSSESDRLVWCGRDLGSESGLRPWDASLAPEELGFRCAVSLMACSEHARALARDVAGILDLDPERAVGVEHWSTEPGAPAEAGEAEAPEVLVRYEHLLFVPARALSSGTPGAVALGLLSTTIPIAEPALEPGVYRLVLDGDLLVLQDRENGRTPVLDRATLAGTTSSSFGARAARMVRGSVLARTHEVVLTTWIAAALGGADGRVLELCLAVPYGAIEATWRATRVETDSPSVDPRALDAGREAGSLGE